MIFGARSPSSETSLLRKKFSPSATMVSERFVAFGSIRTTTRNVAGQSDESTDGQCFLHRGLPPIYWRQPARHATYLKYARNRGSGHLDARRCPTLVTTESICRDAARPSRSCALGRQDDRYVWNCSGSGNRMRSGFIPLADKAGGCVFASGSRDPEPFHFVDQCRALDAELRGGAVGAADDPSD